MGRPAAPATVRVPPWLLDWRPWSSGRATAVGVAALLGGGHFLLGGDPSGLAMLMSLPWLLALPLLLTRPWGRSALGGVRRLNGPALAFCGVLAVGLLQLGPWLPGRPWVWSLTPGLPATTLDRELTIVELVKLVALAAAFLVGAALGRERTRARLFGLSLTYAGAAVCAACLILNAVSPGSYFGHSNPIGGRLTAPFVSPNVAATMFGVSAVWAAATVTRLWRDLMPGGATVAELTDPRRLARLAPAVLALALAGVCLLLTRSRAGLVATLVALLLEAVLLRGGVRGRARSGLALAGLALLALVAAWPLLPAVASRFDLLGGDFGERLRVFGAHAALVDRAPWFGVGLGAWSRLNDMALTPADYPSLWQARAAHNVYLQWLEEGGVVGAGFMAACAGLIAWRLVQAAGRDRSARWTLAPALAALALAALHGAVDFPLQETSITLLLAVTAGCGFGAASHEPATVRAGRRRTADDAGPPRPRRVRTRRASPGPRTFPGAGAPPAVPRDR